MQREISKLRALWHYPIFIALGLIVAIGGPFVVLGLLMAPGACITESRGKIVNVAGYDFEISETSCDLIAKDDAVSVLISKTGHQSQTAIFKYDPGRYLPPEIRATGAHSVQISIPSISSEFFRKDKWEDLSIEYDLGQIDYPSNGTETSE